MNNNVKRPRKASFKDEAIDVDDLASMSNMGGMLSFLETKPEEYARLFAKAAETEASALKTREALTTRVEPTQVETTQVLSGELTSTQVLTNQVEHPPVETLQFRPLSYSAPHAQESVSYESSGAAQLLTTQRPTTQLSTTQQPTTHTRHRGDTDVARLDSTQLTTTHPEKGSSGDVREGDHRPTRAFRQSKEILEEISNQHTEVLSKIRPTQPTTTQPLPTHLATTQDITASGDALPTALIAEVPLPLDFNEPAMPVLEHSAPGLGPSVSLGRGRIHQLKVREAKIVQDGHTGSEQMVYDFLWRTGTPINASLRSIRIGRWGIANAVHISDTTAKAAIKGLMEKLAIDRIGASDSVLGFEYHVHSWGSCLTRRKEQGLTHVIKSKGVVFVNPESGEALTGYFFPGTKPSTTQEATTQVDSPDPQRVTRVVSTRGRGVEPRGTTQVVNVSSPYNQLTNQKTITTTLVREELDLHTSVDEAGIKSLIHAVQNNANDATWPELRHFIQEKAKVFKKVKVDNKFGFLLVAVPRCFESPAFQNWRNVIAAEAQEQKRQEETSRRFLELQHLRAVLIDPSTSEEEKQAAQEVLDILEP